MDQRIYVTRAEVNNGYAEVDGDTVDLRGHTVGIRTRYLASRSVIIGTSFHTALQIKSEESINGFIAQHPGGEAITPEVFAAFARSIRKNVDRSVLNLK